jgi:transposase
MSSKKSIPPESIIRDIKRKTRRKFTSEEKIRIILEGLRGEESIANLCRREGSHTTLCYKWSKAFLEASKRQLTGDTIVLNLFGNNSLLGIFDQATTLL